MGSRGMAWWVGSFGLLFWLIGVGLALWSLTLAETETRLHVTSLVAVCILGAATLSCLRIAFVQILRLEERLRKLEHGATSGLAQDGVARG